MTGVHEFGVARFSVEFVDEEVQGLAFAGELVLFVHDVMMVSGVGRPRIALIGTKRGKGNRGLTDDLKELDFG